VSRTLAESVVDFLSCSGTTSDYITKLRRFRGAEWKQAIPWLHDAGLALYLLQKLKDTNATDILPISAWSRLKENPTANRQRVAYLTSQFDFLNHKFNRAGVEICG
jgi:hypothetical protein